MYQILAVLLLGLQQVPEGSQPPPASAPASRIPSTLANGEQYPPTKKTESVPSGFPTARSPIFEPRPPRGSREIQEATERALKSAESGTLPENGTEARGSIEDGMRMTVEVDKKREAVLEYQVNEALERVEKVAQQRNNAMEALADTTLQRDIALVVGAATVIALSIWVWLLRGSLKKATSV
jgi:hypothetical protein